MKKSLKEILFKYSAERIVLPRKERYDDTENYFFMIS